MVGIDPAAQAKITTEHFRHMFSREDIDALPAITPRQIKPPFTKREIMKAVKSLKSNKTAGEDGLKAEQLKGGPDVVFESIAEIFNTLAMTGQNPKEIMESILLPLKNPGKTTGPPSHLGPINLLSMLRKVLETCILRKISDKINQEIHVPVTQAAHRARRGTTAHRSLPRR